MESSFLRSAAVSARTAWICGAPGRPTACAAHAITAQLARMRKGLYRVFKDMPRVLMVAAKTNGSRDPSRTGPGRCILLWSTGAKDYAMTYDLTRFDLGDMLKCKCLTLMATVGSTGSWNSRHLSRAHRAIPL